MLVAVLTPLWVVCFALGVRTCALDTASPGPLVFPPRTVDDPPVVLGIPPLLRGETSLEPGDRLLRVGQTDLHGVGPIDLRILVAREAAGGRHPEVTFERAGRVAREPLPILRSVGAALLMTPSFLLAAIFLLLRGGGSVAARSFGHSFLATAFLQSTLSYSRVEVGLWIITSLPAVTLCMPLSLRAALRFPVAPDRESAARRLAPWVFVIYGPLILTRALGLPTWWGYAVEVAGAALFVEVAYFATLLTVYTRAYRRADPVGRRQLRWLLVGAWWSLLPPIAIALASVAFPGLTRLFFVSLVMLGLLPIVLAIAIVRYNRFDVDRLISATAAWNTLLALFAVGLFVLLPPLADQIATYSGVEPTWSRAAIGLALAASLLPAQRRLRPRIDRFVFAEHHAVNRGVETLLRDLSTAPGPSELAHRAGEGIVAIFRPESCAIYARGEADYVPVFATGRALPAGFEADGPLSVALERRHEPLALGDAGRRPDAAPLGPFDRAALESLEAEVVLPVRRGETLRALVCVGPKRSGDVYTPTDVTLLAALADKISSELMRFEDARLIQEGREMAQALRRYVPGAIAEELDRGRELVEGEREVSVLFVDLRGYTAYAEQRHTRDVFGSVSRYTEAVSRSVRAHGGSVVEFNGDGMMAVFGAPNPLEDKERCAVEAAFEIVEAVPALGQGGEPLQVGVGIATGLAFVGNIRAVDRLIWSAIGTTTNTAARLQQLTRDFSVSMVVDAQTRRNLGALGERFSERPDVAIRGRRRPQTLYLAR